MSGVKTRLDGPPKSYSRSKRQNRNGTQPTPASSRTKRILGWRSQTPEKTTALISSAIIPMGKLATCISDWLRPASPVTPTPIWRDPPRGLACRFTGTPVSAAAAHTGSHIWCNTGSGAPTQSKMTPVGRPNSATRNSSATASSAVWHGSGSSMMNRPFDSSYSSRAQSLTAHAGGAQVGILDLPDLLVGSVDEFGVDPIAVHVFAAV